MGVTKMGEYWIGMSSSTHGKINQSMKILPNLRCVHRLIYNHIFILALENMGMKTSQNPFCGAKNRTFWFLGTQIKNRSVVPTQANNWNRNKGELLCLRISNYCSHTIHFKPYFSNYKFCIVLVDSNVSRVLPCAILVILFITYHVSKEFSKVLSFSREEWRAMMQYRAENQNIKHVQHILMSKSKRKILSFE